MIRINSSNFDLVTNWYNRAVEHPIARFLDSYNYFDPPDADVVKSEWRGVFFISPSNDTLLRSFFNRSDSTSTILLHSMAPTPRRKLECGRAMETLLKKVLLPTRPRRVTCSVHATNDQSLRLMNKIFGAPWGIDPESFWDRALGEYVDAHHFSIKTDDLIKRYL